MKKVQESKWWRYFTDFCNSSSVDNCEYKFVVRLFSLWEEKEKLYPYVLSQAYAKKIEQDIKEKDEFKTESLSDSDYIKLTLEKAKVWAKRNKITENKLGKFLTDSSCQLLALRGEYYKPLFFFSKSFLNRYELTEDDILKKNSIRAFQTKLYDLLKDSLGEDFID